MGGSDAKVIIDTQIDEKLKRIMEQRNIHTDHNKRTWLEFVEFERVSDLKEDFQIKINRIQNLNKDDSIFLFDNETGSCLGLFIVVGFKNEDDILVVDLKKAIRFSPTLNIKEVLSNEEVSSDLRRQIGETIRGGDK
ncbi:hypothetical protein [Proteiniclasticum ruminis]|uniref:hypothetical protein n=1 Tax=Proteiniclasticum ruminis TaxID=398199 RepID=UPI0028A8E14A|nr:hypothetical protein [Proteiniclasticum ruminis]